MFSMGGGTGGPMGGPSSMASNAAAGLPAADVPGELRRRVEDVLEHEESELVVGADLRLGQAAERTAVRLPGEAAIQGMQLFHRRGAILSHGKADVVNRRPSTRRRS